MSVSQIHVTRWNDGVSGGNDHASCGNDHMAAMHSVMRMMQGMIRIVTKQFVKDLSVSVMSVFAID